MSQCVHTDSFTNRHAYEHGTNAEARRLRDNLYEICEKPANDEIHKDEDGKRIKSNRGEARP